MRTIYYMLFALLIIGCQDEKKKEATVDIEEAEIAIDTVTAPEIAVTAPQHANERFRNVGVKKLADNQYRISGEGQIFEANFGWTVEDGHNELATGHEMTDAGAPEWGKFTFDINVEKTQENSTLTLILFETSAKDGSRVHELPISLPN